jgi:multidrug efflux system outer membrane protein
MDGSHTKERLGRRLFALTTAVILAGCTVGPNWQKPKVATPDAWRVSTSEAVEVANIPWWQGFGDPALDELVTTALKENRDLLRAAARVDQFLGALRTTRSQFYPQFGYNGAVSTNRLSENGQPPLTPGSNRDYDLYTAALGASWQIDLFGRVRRQAEAAQAQVYASEQGRRGVVLSVVTSVTTSYIALRAADRQLEIARAAVVNYADTLKLFEMRFQGGVVSEVELAQVQSQYQQALAVVPSAERQVAQQENLISILLGRNPGAIPRGKSIDQLAAVAIPAGLPASLLERRPDILAAEQQLRAANAGIGVAKSLYYPTISLTGALGLTSTSLGNFVSSSSTAGTLAAGLVGPIFTFGQIEGQVNTAQAAQRESLAFYEQVVLNAFRETNDALIGVQKRGEEHAALVKRVEALRRYAQLSRARFDGGVSSYLEVLYAENELFGAELNAVATLAQRYAELINVYKALGGGWVDQADPLAPKPEGTVNLPAVAAAAAAPAPAVAATSVAVAPAAPAPIAPVSTTEDRVTVTVQGETSVVDVYRVIGSGGVEIRVPATGWPKAVMVRLHGFKALDSVRADAPGVSVACTPARGAGGTETYGCKEGGRSIDAWNARGDYVEVAMPATLLAADKGRFELRWSERAVTAKP